MAKYVTQDGDQLDAICWRHYGHSSGPTEAVLAANPGLAAYGAVLPAGVVITLPVWAPVAPTARRVSLYD